MLSIVFATWDIYEFWAFNGLQQLQHIVHKSKDSEVFHHGFHNCRPPHKPVDGSCKINTKSAVEMSSRFLLQDE